MNECRCFPLYLQLWKSKINFESLYKDVYYSFLNPKCYLLDFRSDGMSITELILSFFFLGLSGSGIGDKPPPINKSLAEIYASIQRSKLGLQDWSLSDLTIGLYLIYLRQASISPREDIKGELISSESVVISNSLPFFHFILFRMGSDSIVNYSRHCPFFSLVCGFSFVTSIRLTFFIRSMISCTTLN